MKWITCSLPKAQESSASCEQVWLTTVVLIETQASLVLNNGMWIIRHWRSRMSFKPGTWPDQGTLARPSLMIPGLLHWQGIRSSLCCCLGHTSSSTGGVLSLLSSPAAVKPTLIFNTVYWKHLTVGRFRTCLSQQHFQTVNTSFCKSVLSGQQTATLVTSFTLQKTTGINGS